MNQHGYCPDCDTRVRFGRKVKIGKMTTCIECGTMLEVVGINPIELTWADYENDSLYDNDNEYESVSYAGY